jgi:aerobic-type carbon monoxide dehydrogenase small subunit (CoxS/CutS family)
MIEVNLTVNGKLHQLMITPEERLIDILRCRLKLTGTKEGCGEGECGACTIILNGQTVNSCLILGVQANGGQITTIEGLGTRHTLHPIQNAFIEEGAVQCGFCTPGMILSAKAFLDENPQPTEEEIASALSGNLCRCTGYDKILRAVKRASEVMGQ